MSVERQTLPPQIRAFIAVRIPPALLEQLAAVQQQLKNEFQHVSWTRPDAMHLTLHFLGDIKSECLPRLADVLSATARGRTSFELQLSQLGSFNNRVLWVGAGEGAKGIASLAEAVRSSMKNFGSHEEEKAFSAHVTLGRFRQRAHDVESTLQKIPAPRFMPWRVSDFELIRSELSPEGSRYTALGSFHLS